MNLAEAGRNIPAHSRAEFASTAATITGAIAGACMLSPACAVEQMEHTWCDVVESPGWACEAWATPIAHTRAIESTHTTLVNRLRFAGVLTISLGCCGFRPVALDDSIVKSLSTHTIRVIKILPRRLVPGKLPSGRLVGRVRHFMQLIDYSCVSPVINITP